jgi:hypothetical protein
VTAPQRVELEFTLQEPSGKSLATSHLPLAIFPTWRGPILAEARIWTPYPELSQTLRKLGYGIAFDPQSADLLVVDFLDYITLGRVREGARLLLLADHVDALANGVMGMRVVAREGTLWKGDWASSFAWLRREGPFARFPGGPLLDYTFDSVMPRHVLTGVAPWDFAADVHAGLFVGWIHRPVGLIVERRYGKGRYVASTFRLAGKLGADPVATHLFDSLVELTLTA